MGNESSKPRTRTGRFHAPWSRLLKVISTLASALLVGSTAVVWMAVPNSGFWVHWSVMPLGPLILVVAALFTVRGYELRGRELLVRRLIWYTRLSLEGLREGCMDREALLGSIRVCGNGGLFSFSGWFWNKRLGRFRAFATDPARAVVLVYADRKVVVTPDEPEEFLKALGFEPNPLRCN